MNIGLTGATGLIGSAFIEAAIRRGHQIIGFSRNPARAIPGCDAVRPFNLERPPDFSGCDAVVHLAGEPILGVFTPAKKRAVVESRLLGTRRVVEGLAAAKAETFICGSAIGFYGDARDTELTETSPGGRGFLAETTAAWEAEARHATTARTVLLRTGIVLARDGGALRIMRPVFRAGLGGIIGDGRQWMSWIHLADQVKLMLFALENLDLSGPLNATAPWPVRHADFVRTLARVLRRPCLFRVPAFALRLALRELADELLESKRVLPEAATTADFGFQFPELEPALRDLV